MSDFDRVRSLSVPVIVRLAERSMTVRAVLALTPGAIIDFPKASDEPLDLLVNNKLVGHGSALKVGENFGIRVTVIGDEAQRAAAIAGPTTGTNTRPTSGADDASDTAGDDIGEMDDDFAAMAAALLDGQ